MITVCLAPDLDLVVHAVCVFFVITYLSVQNTCKTYTALYVLQPQSDLYGLIQVMIVVFGEEPPVFSRPTTQAPYQAFQAAGPPNCEWDEFFLTNMKDSYLSVCSNVFSAILANVSQYYPIYQNKYWKWIGLPITTL